MSTTKEKVAPTTEDDVVNSLLLNDPEFQKYAAEQIKAGTAPLIDPTKGKSGAAPAAAAPDKDGKSKGAGGPESAFFGKKTDGDIKGIDSEEKFKTIVKERFGIVLDKDYDTFLNSTQKWRTDAQKGVEAEKKNKAIDTLMKNLPPVLKAGITEFSKAGNWKKALLDNLSKLDYNVPVENYKKEELASHYFKTKVDEAKVKLADKKIDNDAFETLIDTFHEAAVSKFNAEKGEFEASKKAIIESQDRQKENFNRSVDTAQSFLKQKFADFDDTKLEKAKSRLDGNGFLSLFFEEDGTLKEDGLLRIALAEFGEEEITSIAGQAAKDAVTDTTLAIVDGAAKKAPSGNGGGGAASPAANIDESTKNLLAGMIPIKKEY